MKRLLLLLVVLSLAGVGFLMAGGQQEEATDEEADGKTKIVYWQYFYETKKETVDTLIERFEEENPNVEVVHQTFPYENYNTKVASAVPAGEGPNVINLYYGWMPVYLGSDYLQPLPEEYFNTAEIEDEFFDMISAVKKNGSYYALPTAVRSLALFYNKGLFEEAGLDPNTPPQTLDELVEYGKKLTKRDNNGNLLQEGMTMMLRGQLHHWLREGLIRQFGGQPYSEDNTEVMYDGQAGYDAFEFYVDLNREHEIGEPQFMTDDVTAFKTGNAGLHIDGSFRLGTLDKIEDLNYGVAEIPSHNGVQSNFASFWCHGITKHTSGKEREASAKFLKFLTSPEAMELWLENVGELPAREDIALQDEYRQDPKIGAFIKGLKYAHATYFIDEMAQRKVWLDAYDRVMLQDWSIEDAVDKAAEEEQAVLDKHYND